MLTARATNPPSAAPKAPSPRLGKDIILTCALVPYPLDMIPSQRFRLEQWGPYLAAQGIQVTFIPLLTRDEFSLLQSPGRFFAKATCQLHALVRRFTDVVRAARYDVIIIHRAACLIGPAILERLLSWLRRPIIFDFDDAIFLPEPSLVNRRFVWLKCPRKTATVCRLSSFITAGSNYLADYARRYNPNVAVVPTSIDTDLYSPGARSDRSGRQVIGWSGSATSQTHLELFADVLRDFFRRRPEVELRVQSNRPPSLPGVPFVWRPWTKETEVQELRQFDIGIKPMPDDPWARGKCPMKEIQYMALGIPAVCSPVGTTPEVIRHGVNGFLAGRPEEWREYLGRLLDDLELRDRFGRVARQTVEEGYSMRHCAVRFAEVVNRVRSRGPAPL